MRFNPYTKAMAGVRTVDRKTGEEFNPFNFGKEGRSGKRKASASERMFNADREVNADSKVEVLDKIKGLLDGAADGTFRVTQHNASASIGEEEGEAILRQAFADPHSAEFAMAGQALMNPIKEVIDYEGLTRKLWVQRTVKAGEVIRYDKDPFVVAHVIAEDGQTAQSVVEGDYVYPPEFEISAYPSFELKDQYRAQFDLLARIQDRARQAMEYQEDLAGMNLLTTAGNIVNPTTTFATLNLGALESIRYQIERHRLTCDKFVINRQEVSDLVNTVSTQVDPVTQRELIMAGFIGSILNAMIVTTAGTNTYQILQPGQVKAVTIPEYLGGMAIRVDMFSEPVTEFHDGRPRRGWYWYMMEALALINPAGVALGLKV